VTAAQQECYHKRRSRRVIVWLAVLFAATLVGDYYLYPHWAGRGERSFNRGENGLWLRYRWYFGERDEEDIVRLARQLTERQIRYAYFHVRHIKADGTLAYRYAEDARGLVVGLHEQAPSIRVIAWIYAGNKRGGGNVDLADPQVRHNMINEVLWLVDECGFDGVQWDYEVCGNSDAHFLTLMRESREALPGEKLLSAAVPMWTPSPLPALGWGWSKGYFAEVAQTCDQLVVMCYDSGQYLPRAYVWLVRQQAVHVTWAVAQGDPDCRVLLGVPTYEAGPPAHHAHAENLRMALKGVREGLSDPAADLAVTAGVALFADYTTDSQEWETYRASWLHDPWF